MQPTQYPEANKVLKILLERIQNVLGEKFIGLYLYGSLVAGDFYPDVSDIDLLAVLSTDINDKEFKQLLKMHQDFAKEYKEWDDRIEVQYLSKLALKTFKSKKSKAAVISPGEPFHIKMVGKHWLMNWYMVREKGLTLFGPSPKTIIEPISKEEFTQSVKDHTKSWSKWVKDMHSQEAQVYAILTLCRALYAYKNGEQVSKKQGALWVQKEIPEWSDLIKNALSWREVGRDEQADNEKTSPQTRKFVQSIIDKIT